MTVNWKSRAEAAEAEVARLREAVTEATGQLDRVHDDAFRQCAGLALVRSDGRAFSHMELNRCPEVASKIRAALQPKETDHGK